MVAGAWSLAHGVSGAWSLEPGRWSMVAGAWRTWFNCLQSRQITRINICLAIYFWEIFKYNQDHLFADFLLNFSKVQISSLRSTPRAGASDSML